MKRILLASIALLAVSTALPVLAQDVSNADPHRQFLHSGHDGIARQAVPQPVIELQPVALPQSSSGSGGTERAASGTQAETPKAGPTAQSLSSLSDVGSSTGLQSMLTPRGSAMSTPRQRADREVRRLIRRLD
jgi:hypothetical protein